MTEFTFLGVSRCFLFKTGRLADSVIDCRAHRYTSLSQPLYNQGRLRQAWHTEHPKNTAHFPQLSLKCTLVHPGRALLWLNPIITTVALCARPLCFSFLYSAMLLIMLPVILSSHHVTLVTYIQLQLIFSFFVMPRHFGVFMSGKAICELADTTTAFGGISRQK